VYGVADHVPAQVPRFAADGRTQLGTGFKELTADGRLLYRLSEDQALKVAVYAYRQFDAPRTDQCPAPGAPADECLTYEEQFRTLVYGAYEARRLAAAVRRLRATISWQRQHERRRLARPSSFVAHTGRDDVDTLGATLVAETMAWTPHDRLRLVLTYGGDLYYDRIASAAWIAFTDIDYVEKRSRGQYLDKSGYAYGGGFAEAALTVWQELRMRAGARLGFVAARAPGDPASGSVPVDQSWTPRTANAGVDWHVLEGLSLLVNADRSFRTPNLDDLTARQQTGPGFQFENQRLKPETAYTAEVGARVQSYLALEAWAFQTWLVNGVGKSPREAAACPPNTPQCPSAWTRLQLVNAREASVVRGVEAMATVPLPATLRLRGTIAIAWGQGPNLAEPPSDPRLPYARRVPLSRIPPLNGTAELIWGESVGLTASTGVRWASKQTRLAVADRSDARIPPGGTPGFVVVDLRVGYRVSDALATTLVAENLLDAAYRYLGSSVNGPGRSLTLWLGLGM
jgi:iron complex outermembrane receptor protein/hemoglobin/transferrin/lactoferrin receptor protein